MLKRYENLLELVYYNFINNNKKKFIYLKKSLKIDEIIILYLKKLF